MSDQGKSAAIAQLRREVGFGCPVCRSPFLTWHHFDPPWHIEQHWRPEGMVAMYLKCHPDADEKGDSAGAYSKEELRAMKKTNRSLEDVADQFPMWAQKKDLLIRLGGSYGRSGAPLFSVNSVPQITIGKNEAGMLSLSFDLRDEHDELLLRMEENWLTAYPRNIHDMVVTPKTKGVKVWLGKADVGLELSFRRITLAELEGILDRDRQRANKLTAEHDRENLARMPQEFRALVETKVSVDRVGPYVKQWAQSHCTMDDGLIPFLDFKQMAVYHHGVRFMINDGITMGDSLFDYNFGPIDVACLCDRCSRPRR